MAENAITNERKSCPLNTTMLLLYIIKFFFNLSNKIIECSNKILNSLLVL